MRSRQAALGLVAALIAALVTAMLMTPAATGAAPESKEHVRRYAEYLRPSSDPGVEAVGDDQCGKPLEEREGAWLCAVELHEGSGRLH
jgi:hypothetical protein